MTENAFYPLFVLAAYLLVRMLERADGAFLQVALLAVCVVAFETRAQAVALFAAAATAPLLLALIERRGARATLRRYGWLYGLLGGGAVAALGIVVALGRSPLTLLGAYRAATSTLLHGQRRRALSPLPRRRARPLPRDSPVRGAPRPLARTAPPGPAGARAFAAASLALSVWLLLEVSAFASASYVDRIEERNIFYLAPLALIALLGLAADGVITRSAPGASARRRPGRDRPVLHPLRAVHHNERRLGHLRAPAVVVGAGPLHPPAAGEVGRARRLARCGRPLRAAPAPLRPRSCRRSSPRTSSPPRSWSRTGATASTRPASARSTPARTRRIRTGSTAPSATARQWLSSGRQPALALPGVRERVLQPQRPNRLRRRTRRRCPTRSRRCTARRRANGVLASGGKPIHAAVRPRPEHRRSRRQAARRDPAGVDLYRVDGPIVILTHVSGLYANDTWSGPAVTYQRVECTGGMLAVQLQGDARLFTRPQTRRRDRRRRGRRPGADPGRRPRPGCRVPLRPAANGRCTVRFTVGRTRVPARVEPGSTDTRAPRRPLPRLLAPDREDRLRRLAALARADRRQQLHPRLAAGPRRGGRRRGRRGRRLRADLARRPAHRSRRRWPAFPVELRLKTFLGAHAWRTAWSRAGWPPAERFARLLRRPPLHRLDVPAAGGRAAGDDDPRPRPAPLSRLGDGAERARCTPASTGTRRAPAASSSRTRPSRPTIGSHARLPARPDRRRPPRHRRPSSARTGPWPHAVPPTCSPSRRSSRGRTSARSSRRSRCSPTTGLAALRRRAAPAGASSHSSTAPASSASAASATRSSPASTAAPPRSSTRRASRGSGCRSPRRWPAERPSSPPPTPPSTRPPGAAAVRCDPESAEAIAAAIREALDRRDAAASARARPRRRASRGCEPASSSTRGTGDSRSDRHDAAPADARGHGPLPARPARPPRRAGAADVVPGHLAPALRSPPTCSGTRGSTVDGADVLHCPTFRGPFSSRMPLVVTVHDLAVLRHPEWFNRVDADVLAPGSARASCARPAG